ncbi:23S rRNA pseudouridine(1911/1915/1917) synthase RluD [Candidatus Erwinia haradaeae]|uniref:Pseudouridine synthase n=1 Tax=Candidatus Erwinia haradaeae TaxID=1922217 RepID=A0A451DA57_9GAMM|nr:23S rRNA pseudouridine(1911/1915/1917) synthase RluD [Candidatus Erwinia haradaeae]VFP83122.1 Ribosomal large subunit pseudouridine synthase D [Candidatus Erwinia haradaeae]
MAEQVKLYAIIPKLELGKRLDQALTKLFPQYSRSCFQRWIEKRCITVNGVIIDKAKYKVFSGAIININTTIEEKKCLEASDIPLNIIYEDEHLLLINKPSRLVVHPGAGHINDTMLNALLYYLPTLILVPRAGIVHRLDKDTTGLMVIAKTVSSYNYLVAALKSRMITREYEAIVVGCMTSGGKVNAPIGRHATQRTKMTVHPMGKPAITHYRIIQRFRGHTWLRLQLETGRTHQIRVHMSHISHPVVGDSLYAGRLRLPKGMPEYVIAVLRTFNRQALHATMLRLRHPISGMIMEWRSCLPGDILELINAIQSDTDHTAVK